MKALGSPNRVASLVLLAMTSTNLWTACSSSDDTAAGSPDGGGDAASAPGDAGSTDDDATAGIPACNESFCRVSLPEASGVAVNASWAISPSDVWVGGSGGYVAHFDGASWSRVASGTSASIFGMTMASDGTVWGASGGQALLKLNRAVKGVPENVKFGSDVIFDGVSASGAELFIAGATAGYSSAPVLENIWRYGPDPDGGAPALLSVSPPCPGSDEPGERCVRLHGVWAESATRQWFVGEGGKAYVTDTAPPVDAGDDMASHKIRLVEMNSSSLRTLKAIWGFGPNDVWAVGVQGVIRHWTGGDPKVDGWTIVPSPVTHDLLAIWGSRPDDIWAVGDLGAVIHWDGTSWTERAIPFAPDRRPRFYTVTAAGDDVWIGGANAFLRSNHEKAGSQ